MSEQYTFGKNMDSQTWDGKAIMPSRTFHIMLGDIPVGEVEIRLLHSDGLKDGITLDCRITNYIDENGFLDDAESELR